MGMDTDVRKDLRRRFKDAFSDSLQLDSLEGPPTVVIVDYMQYIKVIGDPNVTTQKDCMRYFVNKVRYLLYRTDWQVHTVVVMVDGAPPAVKHMVEHKKRYANVDRFVSPGDRSKTYFPHRPFDVIPREWPRFAGNFELLRRELYPELFNAFMLCELVQPRPGQQIILSGFPGRTLYHDRYKLNGLLQPWQYLADEHTVLEVVQWTQDELPITLAMEQRDTDLYNRVYRVCCMPDGTWLREEMRHMKNDIGESDVRMFYFDHFFQRDHIVFSCNDGDVFSIGVLYAYERETEHDAKTHRRRFRNRHTAMLPDKRAREAGAPLEEEGGPQKGHHHEPRLEFVNLDKLYTLINEYEPFVKCGVQSPVATFVLLIILGESDFAQKFFHGMGAINVLWPTLMDNLPVFTHLVQTSHGVPRHTRTPRQIVIDEQRFILFAHYCYLRHYDTHCKELKVRSLSFAQLKNKTHSKPDIRHHLPDTNAIRAYCRSIEWNMLYWRNAPLGDIPDCFEQYRGLPYYPYWRGANHAEMKRIDVVCAYPKQRDQVFEQHMHENNMNTSRVRVITDADVEETRKRQEAVIKAYGKQ